MKKCPRCEVNYIEDEQEYCEVCCAEMHPTQNKKMAKQQPPQNPQKNIVFKCNYCNGNKNGQAIGYCGVCSKELIELNAGIKKISWCSNSKCALYLQKGITYDDLIKEQQLGQLCYESRILIDWKAQIGEDGAKSTKQNKKRLLRTDVASGLCVLSTVLPEEDYSEKSRLIFGAFIVDKCEEGLENVECGYVQCTSDFKISLSLDEAKKMRFWKYYANKDNSTRWSSMLYRYLSDSTAYKILNDILLIKKGKADEDAAKKLFDEFCRIKGL